MGQGYISPRFEGWLILICIITIVWVNVRQSHQIDVLEVRIAAMEQEAEVQHRRLWHQVRVLRGE